MMYKYYLFLPLLFAANVFPWGFAGHKIVACIAEKNLSTSTLVRIKPLLAGHSMEDVSIWADKLKGKDRSTGPWHYINLPVSKTVQKEDLSGFTKTDNNILGQIHEDIDLLKNQKGSLKEQKQALWFLIHFMGDVHMPLHVGENNDRGGNEIKVRYFSPVSRSNIGHVTNMHSLWDNLIQIKAGEKYIGLCNDLNGNISIQDKNNWNRGSIEDWALDTYLISRNIIYRNLPEKNINGIVVLPRNYYAQNKPILDKQLEKAGIRLAKVLEDIFGK